MTGSLTLTDHPVQRTGAWATALLAERYHPHGVIDTDLDRVAAKLVADLRRAAKAESGDPAYDWWKVQYALFPNSQVTHTARARWPDLERRISALFDEGKRLDGERCAFCGNPASAWWAKENLPLFDTAKSQNTLPPGGQGWPICRGCRISVWVMPYGAAVGPGSATVLTGGAEELELRFVRRNISQASRIRAVGFGKTVRGAPERVVVAMLREVAAYESVTLWTFKNDNQEPWLRVTETRRPIAQFVQGLVHEPDARNGWKELGRILERRDKAGNIVQPGADLAARTLFEPAGRPWPVLLETMIDHVTVHPERYSSKTWRALAALARHYAKEMLAMDLSVVRPTAELLARWIAAGSSPRGRFNDYVGVALKRYALGQLLMRAEARLLLDQRTGDEQLPMRAHDVQQVIDAARDGAQRRMLLFFAVVDAVLERGVVIGSGPATDEEDEEIPVEDALRSGDDEIEEEYA